MTWRADVTGKPTLRICKAELCLELQGARLYNEESTSSTDTFVI